jgi:hypothetical protein
MDYSMMSGMNRSNAAAVRKYGRLKLIGAGLIFGLVGTALMLNGIQVVTHSTGQPLLSWGLIGAGAVCILLALIPSSWIVKAATIPPKDRR